MHFTLIFTIINTTIIVTGVALTRYSRSSCNWWGSWIKEEITQCILQLLCLMSMCFSDVFSINLCIQITHITRQETRCKNVVLTLKTFAIFAGLCVHLAMQTRVFVASPKVLTIDRELKQIAFPPLLFCKPLWTINDDLFQRVLNITSEVVWTFGQLNGN
jgi:hypothetical protein